MKKLTLCLLASGLMMNTVNAQNAVDPSDIKTQHALECGNRHSEEPYVLLAVGGHQLWTGSIRFERDNAHVVCDSGSKNAPMRLDTVSCVGQWGGKLYYTGAHEFVLVVVEPQDGGITASFVAPSGTQPPKHVKVDCKFLN